MGRDLGLDSGVPKGLVEDMAMLNSFTNKYEEVGFTETANLSDKINMQKPQRLNQAPCSTTTEALS